MNVEERRKSFSGVVQGVFKLGDLVVSAFESFEPQHVSAYLQDITDDPRTFSGNNWLFAGEFKGGSWMSDNVADLDAGP